MGIRAKKSAAVLIAAFFCSGAITIAAFGAVNGNGQADPRDPANTSSVASESSSGESKPQTSSQPASGSSSQASSSPSAPGSGVDVPSSEGAQVTVSLDFNGGAGGSNRIVVKSGTPVADLATPTRKGYKFSGWSSGGNLISSSLKLTSDIFLIAQWEKVESSSQRQQQQASASQSSVDTHQSEVDAAASRADETISDPDTLSSQDWNALLSSSETSSAAAGAMQGSAQSSSQAQKASTGGVSWLFILGLVLIVLALAGIGVFIYLQFFSHPRGPRGPRGGREDSEEDSTIEFTDISSYSNQHHSPVGNPSKELEELPQASSAQSRPSSVSQRPQHQPAVPAAPRNHVESPVPVRSSAPEHLRTPARPAPVKAERAAGPLPKAQAQPVENSDSSFDWEKFFNEDDQ